MDILYSIAEKKQWENLSVVASAVDVSSETINTYIVGQYD